MKNQQEFLKIIEDYIERDVFPGVNFAIIEGEKVNEYLLGNSAIYPKTIKLTQGKKWDLASLTKVVGTGTAVINLVLAGKLEIDAPLQKYYSKFTDRSGAAEGWGGPLGARGPAETLRSQGLGWRELESSAAAVSPPDVSFPVDPAPSQNHHQTAWRASSEPDPQPLRMGRAGTKRIQHFWLPSCSRPRVGTR